MAVSNVSEAFSGRARNHPRVRWFQASRTDPLVLAVENQLLVCSSGYDVTVQRLNEMDISFQVLTTLLDGIAPRHTDEDVVILALGLPGPNGEDIFAVTQAVRNALH